MHWQPQNHAQKKYAQGGNNAYSYFHIINFGDIYGYGRNAFDNRCMDSLDFFNAT